MPPMHLPLDLRGRVALLFGGFGAVLSIVMAIMLYQGTHDLGQRLVDETLSAELDDYIARRERNPASLPPSSAVMQGYVSDDEEDSHVPDHLSSLPVGRHDIQIGTLGYRVAVLERGKTRYYMLHDTSWQIRREQRFGWMLALMVVVMTLLSALGGIWISRTVVAPVANLAAKVRHRNPNDWEHPLSEDFPSGEVGELARVFDRHLMRMRAFTERERAFSNDISHELRTALAVILSTTEILLEDDGLDDKQKQRMRRIERAARDMSELGTTLLLMAREEKASAAGAACVVADVVAEAIAEQRYLLGGKSVEVVVSTTPELVLAVDAGLVKILVTNLIRNAFSYTSTGRVTVTLDAQSLIISDTGKGIPAHAIQQVFVRHFRDIASEGAGIGLPLVKRICDRYGWAVRLESEDNKGTLVCVSFV